MQESFGVPVRAHHVEYLLLMKRIEHEGLESGLELETVQSLVRMGILDLITASLRSLALQDEDEGTEDSYRLDVIGSDMKEIPRIASLMTQALLGLHKLRTGAIMITTGKDGVCAACAVGAHCETFMDFHDGDFLNDVSYFADMSGIPHTVLEDGSLLFHAQDFHGMLSGMIMSGNTFSHGNGIV